MKNLLFILLLLFTGCKCTFTLAQYPPQYIYAGSDCNASLPDYRQKVTVTDNCTIASIIQAPVPGYQLSPTNMSVIVNIKATDASGNSRTINFSVALLDTIKPVMRLNDPLGDNWKVIDKLYNQADLALWKLILYDNMVIYPSKYTPNAVGNSYIEGLKRITYPIWSKSTNYYFATQTSVDVWSADGVAVVDTSLFRDKALVTWTYPGHALTGAGKRVHAFVNKDE